MGSVCDKELRKHGHALSELPERIFRGYVREPWGFLIAFLATDLFCIGAPVSQAFFCHIMRRAPKRPRLCRRPVKENWRTV